MSRLKKTTSALLLLAILLAVASRFGLLTVSMQLDKAAIVPRSGHAYAFQIPYPSAVWQFALSGDTSADPTLSSLVLLQDGRALGPAHSQHDAIYKRGMGAFSHWGETIVFSSADNRDPRTSGEYVAKIPLKARLPVILALVLLFAALNFRELPAMATAIPRRMSRPGMAAAVIVLLTFGVTEFVAGKMVASLPDPRAAGHLYNPYRGHELSPNDGLILHSSDGFRSDHPISKTKSPGTFRIFALGGSALYGISAGGIYPPHPPLPNDKTVTAFLEARINAELQQRGEPRRVEVINAGVTGYETFQHLVYANETLVDYQPDLFIFFDGWNDWFRALPNYNPWKEYPYSSVSMTHYLNHPSVLVGAYLLSHALAPYSDFAEFVYRTLHTRLQAVLRRESIERRKVAKAASEQLSANRAEAQQAYSRRTFLLSYRQIAALSKSVGAQTPLVFLQPVVTFEDKSILSPADKRIYDITSAEDPSLSTWGGIRATLPALFNTAGIEFHDIGQIGGSAQTDTQLYIDYCHLSPNGAERAADLMFPAVMQRVDGWLAQHDYRADGSDATLRTGPQ